MRRRQVVNVLRRHLLPMSMVISTKRAISPMRQKFDYRMPGKTDPVVRNVAVGTGLIVCSD
jgi:hypothetical protein